MTGISFRQADPGIEVSVKPGMAQQTKAGRARLVTTARTRPTAQDPLDRFLVVGQRPLLQQLVGTNCGKPDRARVNIQPHRNRRKVIHGRRPPYVALPGHPRQPTTDA
jgi:hypothetical protein